MEVNERAEADSDHYQQNKDQQTSLQVDLIRQLAQVSVSIAFDKRVCV